jgi:thiol-disulfide isomerase/thioredoxin
LLLAFALSTACAVAQQPATDPIKLLNQVADRYISAKSIHVEANIHRTTHTDLSDFSNTSILSAYIAPGNRFRYEGRTSQGAALIVSDGTNEWGLRRSFAQYAKAPAGTYFRGQTMYAGDDDGIIEAHRLFSNVTDLRDKVDLARPVTAETLDINGRKVLCTVIQFEYAQTVERDPSEPIVYHHTIWIDPASLSVIRLETRNHNQQMQGMLTAPYAPYYDFVDTTTYTVVDLSFEPKPDTFTFVAPPGSTEVAKLPNPYPEPGTNNSPYDAQAAAYIGKPLPDVRLHDSTGAEVAVSRYRGHPLLIDVWATWCGPCMNDLTALGNIRASTAATDLQIIGIDEDYKSDDARALLKKRGYDWQDFHLNRKTEKQLSLVGVPLVVLTDAAGTVVYYHTGGGDTKGLAIAIAKLGKQYEAVHAQ